jgi:hypothetical protein
MGTLVRSLAPKLVVALCVVTVMGACADLRPAAGTDSATSNKAATTISIATSTSTTGGESTSPPNDLDAGDPPQVDLKEPGYYQVLPSDEVANHFIFGFDVSPSHTTTYTSSRLAETWSMTARVDGELVHYLGTGGMAGEMVTYGGDVWVRDDSGQWVIDEEMFELPIFVAFPSPDFAYAVAYGVFDDLEFVGWVETGGDDVAVYAGGADASAKVAEGMGEDPPADHDGRVEVWWSPDGYFAKVEVEMSTATGVVDMSWTVTDVGTTEVEPPA